MLAAIALAMERDGPASAPRRDASFMVAALAHGEDGSVGRAIARGGDFDVLTAGRLAVIAAALAARRSGSGPLTPAQALEPASLLDALRPYGLSWERG